MSKCVLLLYHSLSSPSASCASPHFSSLSSFCSAALKISGTNPRPGYLKKRSCAFSFLCVVFLLLCFSYSVFRSLSLFLPPSPPPLRRHSAVPTVTGRFHHLLHTPLSSLCLFFGSVPSSLFVLSLSFLTPLLLCRRFSSSCLCFQPPP